MKRYPLKKEKTSQNDVILQTSMLGQSTNHKTEKHTQGK